MQHLVLSLATVLGLQLAPVAQAQAPGLRMYAPADTSDTFLIDTNNVVVHTWPSTENPGGGVYVEDDGTLIRTLQVEGAPFIGGRGGGVQRIAFDGTLLWDYRYASATGWSHHDIAPLPNGNVLIIAWDILTAEDAFAAGREFGLLESEAWLPDAIVEVQQTGATTGDIVWEWHMMDHVVQDMNPNLPNFGVVADHPELLNINYPRNTLTTGEFNHCNAINYDPVRDLIVLNSPFQNEFWLIDHSTTTAEAAGHSGGNFGKGGDFVYRWGNPQAYNRGSSADQKLFFQHGTYVIPEGLPGAGNIMCFNNRARTGSSAVIELALPGTFNLAPGAAYGPSASVWEYMAPGPDELSSVIMSNAERLPNGNTLICSAVQRRLFEVTTTGEVVWDYVHPGGLIFQVSYVDRSLWSDQKQISMSSGGTARVQPGTWVTLLYGHMGNTFWGRQDCDPQCSFSGIQGLEHGGSLLSQGNEDFGKRPPIFATQYMGPPPYSLIFGRGITTLDRSCSTPSCMQPRWTIHTSSSTCSRPMLSPTSASPIKT